MVDTVYTGFATNEKTEHYIGKVKTTMSLLAGGMTSIEPDFDEDTDTKVYFDSDGGSTTVSKSKSYPFKCEGERVYGNAAQELVRAYLAIDGNKALVYFVVVEPDGSQLEGPARISAIKPFGGNAEDNSTFSFTVTFVNSPLDFDPTGVERNNREGTKTVVPTV